LDSGQGPVAGCEQCNEALGIHKRQTIYRLTESLSATEEGLFTPEFANYLVGWLVVNVTSMAAHGLMDCVLRPPMRCSSVRQLEKFSRNLRTGRWGGVVAEDGERG
jgi:hypothetical protein